MKKLIRIGYYAIQWTWGLPQNVVGFCFLLFLGKQSRAFFHGALATYYTGHLKLSQMGSVSLGMFVFVDGTLQSERQKRVLVHEYGHTIQSLIFGPVFFFVIGLPSVIWAARYEKKSRAGKSNTKYVAFFTERNANHWGERITGKTAIDW